MHNSTAKRMERMFNCIPPYIRNIEGKKIDIFKKGIDNWLQIISELPRIDNYGARVAAETNSLTNQAAAARRR